MDILAVLILPIQEAQYISSFVLFLKDFIYLFIYLRGRERQRACTSRGSGRGRNSLPAEQGVQCGFQSQDHGIMT